MSKQAYYFSHDSNARNDLKVVKLRRELKMEGYGIFWCIIEMLREANNYQLPIDSIDDVAHQISVKTSLVERVIKNYGLFVIHDGVFYSERLISSMDTYNTVKQKLSEAGKRGMAKRYAKEQTKNNNSFI